MARDPRDMELAEFVEIFLGKTDKRVTEWFSKILKRFQKAEKITIVMSPTCRMRYEDLFPKKDTSKWIVYSAGKKTDGKALDTIILDDPFGEENK